MRTHNIPFSIYRGKHSLNYLNSAAVGFFQGTLERVRNSRGRRAISVRAIEVLLYIFREKDEKIYGRANYVSHLKACHTQEVSSKSAFDFCYFDVQSTLVISTSVISNNRLSRRKNLVLVST